MKRKNLFAAVLICSALVAAGCGNKDKETEAPKQSETAAAAAETKETTAATEAKAAQTEAKAAGTEAEAVAAGTEAEAVAAGTEAEAISAGTEAETYETEIIEYDYTETETEDDYEISESELLALLGETESEIYDYTETETEYQMPPKPVFTVSDYLEIKDDAYKNITVQVSPAQKVTEEEVNSEIQDAMSYLENYDEIVVKKEEGTVKTGDTVNIDYVGTKDGEAFDGGSAEGYDLVIGSGSFIDGFEDGLIGKEIGSEVDLNLTFPEDYGVEELNGADVVFHVTLNYIAELPELTDDLAKELSGEEYDNVKDYVESVRSDLQANYDDEYRNNVYTQIMTKLNEAYPLEQYPEENVEYYVNDIMDRYINSYASMYGMSVEDFISASYGVTEEEFREQQVIPAAKANLSQEIILTAIADKEGITMTDEELDKLLEGYAKEYGMSVEALTAGTDRETIRSSELQQKTMEWLYENVKIEEIEETETGDLSGAAVQTEAETAVQTSVETEAQTEAE